MIIRWIAARKKQRQPIFNLREGMRRHPIPPKQRNHYPTLVTTLLHKQSTLPRRSLLSWRQQFSPHCVETWHWTPQEVNKVVDIETGRARDQTSVSSSRKSSLNKFIGSGTGAPRSVLQIKETWSQDLSQRVTTLLHSTTLFTTHPTYPPQSHHSPANRVET